MKINVISHFVAGIVALMFCMVAEIMADPYSLGLFVNLSVSIFAVFIVLILNTIVQISLNRLAPSCTAIYHIATIGVFYVLAHAVAGAAELSGVNVAGSLVNMIANTWMPGMLYSVVLLSFAKYNMQHLFLC
jgi:hypothetical protein